MIVFGVAVSQINRALLQYRISFSTLLTIVPLTIVIVVPNLASDIDIVKIRMREDSRVVMRTWADNSLEPDAFLVTKENHKTFNPFFGGIEGKKWFNWWYTDNLLDHPIDVWHRQFDIGYVAIPLKQLQDMKQSQQGQDFLAPLLHLRDIVSPPPYSGPEMSIYRLWRMQVQTNYQFGDAIQLVGYDRSGYVATPGDTLTLRLYWQANQKPRINYSVYIHLSNLDRHMTLSQVDGEPVSADRPTSTWVDPTETLISAPITMHIPSDLPTGDYRILVGLYDSATGQPLSTQNGDTALFILKVRQHTLTF